MRLRSEEPPPVAADNCGKVTTIVAVLIEFSFKQSLFGWICHKPEMACPQKSRNFYFNEHKIIKD